MRYGSEAVILRCRLIRRNYDASASGRAVGQGQRVRPTPITAALAVRMATDCRVAVASRKRAGSLIAALSGGTAVTTIC